MNLKKSAILLVIIALASISCGKRKKHDFPDLVYLTEQAMKNFETYVMGMENSESADDYIETMNTYIAEYARIMARTNAAVTRYAGYGEEIRDDLEEHLKVSNMQIYRQAMAFRPRLLVCMDRVRKFAKHDPRLDEAMERISEMIDVIGYREAYIPL